MIEYECEDCKAMFTVSNETFVGDLVEAHGGQTADKRHFKVNFLCGSCYRDFRAGLEKFEFATGDEHEAADSDGSEVQNF